MNIQAKSKSPRSINWKQIAIIAVVLGVAGFQYFNKESGSTAQLDLPGEIDLNSELPKNGQSSKPDLKFKPIKSGNSDSTKPSSTDSGKPYLKQQGRKKVSPAGLVYAGSRIEHVMRHAKDMPTRKDSDSHGVFDADTEDDVFRLLDEAYKKTQSNSPDVSKQTSQPNPNFQKTVYSINMKRRIGYLGGKKGKRNGNPPLSKIKLVVGNDNGVITAYPY